MTPVPATPLPCPIDGAQQFIDAFGWTTCTRCGRFSPNVPIHPNRLAAEGLICPAVQDAREDEAWKAGAVFATIEALKAKGNAFSLLTFEEEALEIVSKFPGVGKVSLQAQNARVEALEEVVKLVMWLCTDSPQVSDDLRVTSLRANSPLAHQAESALKLGVSLEGK